jgi:hypothetical protein
VLGIIVAVVQLEGHVLQPLLLGRAVKLHPLAVVLAIATGLVVAGIAGALFAVPLLAVLNSGIRSLRSAADEHVDPDDVHTSSPEETGPDEPGLDRQPDLGRGFDRAAGVRGGVPTTVAGAGGGSPSRVATPDLTLPTRGARKCADRTTVDSSQRSHEAAQGQVHREHGG